MKKEKAMRRGRALMVAVAALGLMAASGCAKSVTAGDKDGGGQPQDSTTNQGNLGQRCTSSSECDSGLCLVVGQEYLCSISCGECPEGFYCARVEPSTAPNGEEVPPPGFYCLPDRGGLCKSCGSDINCDFVGDRCLDLGDGVKVCGRDCSYDQTCPTGYNCISNQCSPIGNTCDCTAERVGATQRCENSNQFGTCFGVETCYIAGWEGCTASVPGPEVCDGIDNDCDGNIPSDEFDNDNSGTIDCLENCVPEAEICDLKDNDCNQHVDDGDPVEMCGVVTNGTPACVAGVCVIESCQNGYSDVNGVFEDGCECQLAQSGGPTCEAAEDLGNMDDIDVTIERSGVLPADGAVWYKVTATDLPDGVSGPTCDGFHFRVLFLQNPESSYRFEVLAVDCTHTPECSQSLTDFQVYDNYREGSGTTAIGECECVTDPAHTDGEGRNECSDSTETYYIKVLKVPNSTVSCDPFVLEVSNGHYQAP